jgi:hypothetical protein
MKLNLFVHARPASDWDAGDHIVDGQEITVWRFDDMTSQGYVMVTPVTVDFEFPEGWDPRAQQIDALRMQKEKLRREFSESVMKIDRQINQLLAIENTVEA